MSQTEKEIRCFSCKKKLSEEEVKGFLAATSDMSDETNDLYIDLTCEECSSEDILLVGDFDGEDEEDWFWANEKDDYDFLDDEDEED